MGLKNDFFKLPSKDEIEVTLIGTGGGYGESIVIKFSESDWIIIDSCIDPSTKISLPISYLNNLGVNVEDCVKAVICTHWHNDHILGLSDVLKYCKNAIFCMPSVNDTDKFLRYVGFDCIKSQKGSISSLNEFSKCIDIVKKRNGTIKRVCADRLIYKQRMHTTDNRDFEVELYSLSPSDSVIANFDIEIADRLNNFSINKKEYVEKSANEKSVVIYLKYLDFSILLGADLEVRNMPNEGWNDIINNSQVISNKSIIYKIPHHGSSNGYTKEIYDTLIRPEAIIKLSPWNRSSKLPEVKMLNIYKDHSENLYITSPVDISNKPKKRTRSELKLITLFSKKLKEIKFKEGIVQTRHNITEAERGVSVKVSGNAFKID